MHTANAVLIYSTLWGRDVVPEEITKQMRYLGKRCLTPDHDVLTPWGWRGIADVKQGDIIAQWDRGRITFAPILEKFEYENTDPLTLLQQRGIDQCVTPNHRMVYMTNGRYKVAEAQQLPKGANIPTVGEYSGYIIPEYPPELLAAIQADANKSGKQFRFQLTKPRKVQRLLELCRMHNIPYTHTDRGTCQDITVKPHWRIPKDFGPFLLSWRGDIIDRLLAEIPFWDGYTTAGRTEYTTSVYNNAMWVHTLLHLRGNGSYMRHKKVKGGWTGKQFDAWTVSWNRRQFSCPDTRAVSMPGNVHCVSVPSSFFLVRRNDTISVTGNSVHAANYGMRGKKLSDILLKEHLTYTPQECDRLIGAYMEAQPAIRKWQRKTREVVLRRRRLFTNWGRDINFDGFRLDDELWRLAYAFIPQSEVGDLTNQWMLKPLYYWLKENHMKARIVLQVHDSVAVTCPPEEAYDVAEYLVGQIERPRRYGRCLGHSVELTIPAEVTIGKSWKGDFEWKVIPTREEFDDKVKELT